MDSMSTIPTSGDGTSTSNQSKTKAPKAPLSPDVKEVYKELQDISEKLKVYDRYIYMYGNWD